MEKKRRPIFITIGAFFQIALLVSLSIVTSITFSDSFLVSAAPDPTAKIDVTTPSSSSSPLRSGASTLLPTDAIRYAASVPSNAVGEITVTTSTGVTKIPFKDFTGVNKLPDGTYVAASKTGTNIELNAAQYGELSQKLGANGISLVEPEKFSILGNVLVEGGLAHLANGLFYAAAVAGVIQVLAPLLGAKKELTNALTGSAVAGILAWKGLTSLGSSGFNVVGGGNFFVANAPLIGVGVAAVVFVLLYKKEKKQVVTLECLPWEAPIGGADCEKCNQDPLKPCSEYRCKSLGQACDIVNKGTSEERCTWVARNDVNSPTITPWIDALTPRHRYTPLRTRPDALGTTIVSEETQSGCIKPFTPLAFGLVTNEPSQCKIDLEGNKTFDELSFYFGESNLYRYNHTQQLRLPSADSLAAEGIEVPTEGLYNFFVQCRDVNGNTNTDQFVFNFCVDKSPDTTPPVVEETSITSGSPVSFGSQTVPLTLYVNEPAECRWSTQDKTYNLMENNMSCSSHVYEQNAQQQYPCSTTLTGVKDHAENTFYFRCSDQPLKGQSERNINQESYPFVLRGSQLLSITSVGPNSTFTGSTDTIAVNLTVRTDDGANEGSAICSFSPSGDEGTFITMFETNSHVHKQILSLSSGSYSYYFRCVDAGGNAARTNTTFSVLTDRTAPSVSRVYKETDALKIVTNEDASCVYSLANCNYAFDDGISTTVLNSAERTLHALPWTPHQAYYIKCRDNYGNEPSPNSCSIIASAGNGF